MDGLIDASLKKITSICNMFLDKQRAKLNCENAAVKNLPEETSMSIEFDVLSNDVQQCLQQGIHHNANDINMQDDITYLNNYIVQDGHIQPLLVIGEPGSGKSLLLSMWVSHLQQSLENSCILYHIVSPSCRESMDPVQLMRRFHYLLLDSVLRHEVHHQLDKDFPLWLDRACTKHTNGVIIVIDGADMLDADYLTWLVDPLPVPVRVVISVSSNNYPKQWSSWPHVTLSADTSGSLAMFVSNFASSTYLTDVEEVTTLISESSMLDDIEKKLSNHLFRNLAFVISTHIVPGEKLKKVLQKCLKCITVVDLYSVAFKLLLKKYNDPLIIELLCLISLSYNGLTLMELHQLTDYTVADVYSLLIDLYTCHIVVNVCGLIQLARPQVKEAIERSFNLSQHDLQIRIIKMFSTKLKENCVTYRVVDELPWQLMRIGDTENLKVCMQSSMVFIGLYEKGRLSNLLNYWKILNCDLSSMHQMLMNIPNDNPLFYDLLGSFMEEQGLFKLAHISYERALEIKEIQYDFDDVRIGMSFLHLARLFMQWKKFQTAQDYFKQAVDICQNNEKYYAKVLESFVILYSMQENSQDADTCKKQALKIRQSLVSEKMAKSFQNGVNECRMIIEQLKKDDWPAADELARYYTDVGLIFYNLKQYSEACELLEEALNMFSNIGGDDSIVADAMCKLSFVYETLNENERAENLLEQALGIYLQGSPPQSRPVQSALKSLVMVLTRQKKFEKIETIYRKIIELEEQRHSENHISTAHAVNVLAVHLTKMHRFEDASILYKRALNIYINQVGFQHQHVSEVLCNLAKLYLELHDSQLAAQLYGLSLEPNRTLDQLPIK